MGCASTSSRRCAQPTRACAISPASTARPVDEAFQRQRTEALLGLLRAEAPDVVITEQFPFGRTRLRFELLPLLEAARGLPKRPLIACSVRDVVRRAGARTGRRDRGAPGALRRRADPRRPPASYLSREASPAGCSIKERAFYTGYVSERDLAQGMQSAEGKDEVVVSVGGGAVGAPLLKAAIAARPKDGAGRPHLAIAGWARTCRRRTEAALARRGRHRHRAGACRLHDASCATPRSRSPGRLQHDRSRPCAAPIAPCWCPSPPSARPSRRIALRRLAERGMVAVVPPGTLSAQSLADAVGRALAGPSLESFPPCDVDGGSEDGGAIASPVGQMSTWADLSDEAARWSQAGRTAELWWRDDDAADVGPALERLLAIHRDSGAAAGARRRCRRRRRRRWPTGWRASRASTCFSMVTRTSITPAAGDNKKIELGTERPAMLVLGELGTGRMALERLFGARPCCRCWCRPGTASRRPWCRPCRRSALPASRPSVHGGARIR